MGENAMKQAFYSIKRLQSFLREIIVYIRTYKNIMIKFIGEF